MQELRTVQRVPASPLTTFAPVAQVYGVCFDEHGEVMVLSLDCKTGWNLPGGKPEPGESWRATLQREVRERACAELGEIALLGALAVSEAGAKPHFQLFCAARIIRLDELRPGPATGKSLTRRMLPTAQFMEVVGIEDYRSMFTSALRWAEKHPPKNPQTASPEATSPGGRNPALPGSRGITSGLPAHPGSAAPRPRRRAGLG